MYKILIIEDDKIFLEVMSEYLTLKNFDVTAIDNGYGASSEINSSVDLIILDLHMPGVNGIDVLTESKNNYPQTPVLVISADPIIIEWAMEYGADDYLFKPFNLRTLQEAVEENIKNCSTCLESGVAEAATP